jgi:hypothetical protein
LEKLDRWIEGAECWEALAFELPIDSSSNTDNTDNTDNTQLVIEYLSNALRLRTLAVACAGVAQFLIAADKVLSVYKTLGHDAQELVEQYTNYLLDDVNNAPDVDALQEARNRAVARCKDLLREHVTSPVPAETLLALYEQDAGMPVMVIVALLLLSWPDLVFGFGLLSRLFEQPRGTRDS